MFLKRVEIAGFKSFANRTVLDFLPSNVDSVESVRGITAIVGPNGSGKSNVADAIRWAIGEQSVKNLRGKKSEDVIFSGSGKKARLGSASVTLVFDNSDKRIPIEYTEVSVTRRLYRSGESEYLINGTKSRLSDIVDLLAQAGIGKDSHCVVTQGMSDAVLNATPLERRAILEEAAGVKPYQLRRERALRKLESTADNVLRVESLMTEIEPHLKNLKRQAEKAAQAETVAKELRAKQLLLYGYLWATFDGERSSLRAEETRVAGRLAEAERESEELNAKLLVASRTFEATGADAKLEEEVRIVRMRLNTNEREVAILDGRIQAEEERRKPREVVESIPVDLAYVRTHVDEMRSAQEQLIERLGTVERLEELQELKELARVVGTRLSELSFDAGKGSVVKRHTVTLPPEVLAESDARLAELTTKKKSLQKSLIADRERVAMLEETLHEEQRRVRAAREQFFDLERAARARSADLNTFKDAFNEARIRLARVEVREEDLRGAVRQELQMDVMELAPVEETVDTERTEREILRLKVQVEHIGSIDPLVLDEYRETEERFDFLSHESEDLRLAIESLRAVVREMDDRITASFDTAFRKINDEFQRYFSLIFGGGKATLLPVTVKGRTRGAEDAGEEEISGEEDESALPIEQRVLRGIEIDACPPGKKINSLAMLSGGERSLTSLALLFAIIASNPPPFAVLDEVEAALDESNSRRFSRVLQEFVGQTQFVAITHNRETMRQATLLYGVTMGDDGISKLLSVHLDQIGAFTKSQKSVEVTDEAAGISA